MLWRAELFLYMLLLPAVAVLQGAQATNTAASGVSVTLSGAVASPANKYQWSVDSSVNPSGLTVRGDGRSIGTVQYTVQYNRTGPARSWLLSGTVTVSNAAGGAAVTLSEVQVGAQLQAPGALPISKTADCASDESGAVQVAPGAQVSCPFAMELPHGSPTRAVTLVGLATLARGAGQLSSATEVMSLATAAASTPVNLGRCAVLTDTFHSDGARPTNFYGSKQPDIGSGTYSCDPVQTTYVASFGPFSGLDACGTFRAVQVARVNPLGGDQLTTMDSTSVLLVVDSCTTNSPAPLLVLSPPPPSPSPPPPPLPSPPPPPVRFPSPPPPVVVVQSPSPSPKAPSSQYEYQYEYAYEAPQTGAGDITYDGSTAAGRRRRRLLQVRGWRAAAAAEGLMLEGGAGLLGDSDWMESSGLGVLDTPMVAVWGDAHGSKRALQEQQEQQQTRKRPQQQVEAMPMVAMWEHAGSSKGPQQSQHQQDSKQQTQVMPMVAMWEDKGSSNKGLQQPVSQQPVSQQQQHQHKPQQHEQQQDKQQQHKQEQQTQVMPMVAMWEDADNNKGQHQQHQQDKQQWHGDQQQQVQAMPMAAMWGSEDSSKTKQQLTLHQQPQQQQRQQSVQQHKQEQQAQAMPMLAMWEDADDSKGEQHQQQRQQQQQQQRGKQQQQVQVMPMVAMWGDEDSSKAQQQPHQQDHPLKHLLRRAKQGRTQGQPAQESGEAPLDSKQRSLLQAPRSSPPPPKTPAKAPSKPPPPPPSPPAQQAVAITSLQAIKPVMYEWQPTVTVKPPSVVIERGASASVNYTVKFTRAQRASGHLLTGSLKISNPQASPMKLTKVTAEVPRPIGAAAAWVKATCPVDGKGTLQPVPAKGSVMCGFSLQYVSAVPTGSVVARVVTKGGSELSSVPLSFNTSAAVRQVLGACALLSDTFSRPDAANPLLLAPAALDTAPATGTKAPELPNTKQLCGDGAFEYTARIGPISSSLPCGSFKVVTTVRASPTNGTQPTTAAITTVDVGVKGCPPSASSAPTMAELLATGGPLSTIGSDGSGANSSLPLPGLELESGSWDPSTDGQGPAAALKLPVLTTTVTSVGPSALNEWSVQSTPVPSQLSVQYSSSVDASFTVVFTKSSAASSGRQAVSGRVLVENPNLIDNLPLARVQVELFRPGVGSKGVVALATCPRGPDGLLQVDSQLTGSGQLECAFTLDAGSADIGLGAAVTAVAVMPDGREAASAPVALPDAASSFDFSPVAGSSAGECAVLSNSFVLLGDDGNRLLPWSTGAAGGERLPGEGCGGGPDDVVCDSRTITYSSTFGHLAANQCGTYKATNLAKADPTTGPQQLASAMSDVTITVTGCPGPVLKADIVEVTPQLLSGSMWAINAYVDTPQLTLHWSKSGRVEFSSSFVPIPANKAQVLVGTVRVQNLGTAPAKVASVQVEVNSGSGQAPVSVPADCPLPVDRQVAAGVTLMCHFVAPYAQARSGSVAARVLLAAGGGERSSKAVPFDFSSTFVAVDAGDCAVVADGFMTERGQLKPNSTSRPAEAEKPQMICNGQSFSFGARVGPFTSKSCGSYLITYTARVNPVTGDLAVGPQSAAASLPVKITGCPTG